MGRAIEQGRPPSWPVTSGMAWLGTGTRPNRQVCPETPFPRRRTILAAPPGPLSSGQRAPVLLASVTRSGPCVQTSPRAGASRYSYAHAGSQHLPQRESRSYRIRVGWWRMPDQESDLRAAQDDPVCSPLRAVARLPRGRPSLIAAGLSRGTARRRSRRGRERARARRV